MLILTEESHWAIYLDEETIQVVHDDTKRRGLALFLQGGLHQLEVM